MGMTLDVLKTFVYLTINFPAEKRGFGYSMTASGCAMVGSGLLDSASSLLVFCDVEVPQQWPGLGIMSLYRGICCFKLAFGDSFEAVEGVLRL